MTEYHSRAVTLNSVSALIKLIRNHFTLQKWHMMVCIGGTTENQEAPPYRQYRERGLFFIPKPLHPKIIFLRKEPQKCTKKLVQTWTLSPEKR